MRNPREDLQHFEAVQSALDTIRRGNAIENLRRQAEMLPDGNGLRVSIETYLKLHQTLEEQTRQEIDNLRYIIERRYS